MKQDFRAMGRKGNRKSQKTKRRIRREELRESSLRNLRLPDLANWQMGDLIFLFNGLRYGK